MGFIQKENIIIQYKFIKKSIFLEDRLLNKNNYLVIKKGF